MSVFLSTPVFANSGIDALSINKNELSSQDKESDFDYVKALIGKDIEDTYLLIQKYVGENPGATDEELEDYLQELISSDALKPNSRIQSRVNFAALIPTSSAELGPSMTKVFNSNPINGLSCLSAGGTALGRTGDLWEVGCLHNGNGDAFRHAYWNALMGFRVGSTYAQKFVNAYEADFPGPSLENQMDSFNNSAGRNIGVSKTYNYPNPFMNDSAIETDVLVELKAGKMKRFYGSDIGTKTSLVGTNNVGLK